MGDDPCYTFALRSIFSWGASNDWEKEAAKKADRRDRGERRIDREKRRENISGMWGTEEAAGKREKEKKKMKQK